VSARRSKGGGYTLIEVMMALSVLAIGASGVIALQRATLIGNTHARNLAIANSIAITWAERLRTDALQWNDPGGTPDLDGDTDWLRMVDGMVYPARATPTPILALGTPNADVLGTDVYAGDASASAFCTHVRFRRFTTTTGEPLWPNLMRADIRVFWERNGSPVECGTAPTNIDTETGRYGAIYLTTSVIRNTSSY
jgi:prepilin-type N-terminal cleavage/methylation domain-containing protein